MATYSPPCEWTDLNRSGTVDPRRPQSSSASVTSFLLCQAQLQIRELEKKLIDMSKLAHEDYLTGILNRRGFEVAIAREMARARRHNTPLCIALLDLDDFKQINDTHGHAIGDLALARFAQIMSAALRQTDSFARLGGEEFVIALPDTTHDSATDTLARLSRMLTETPLRIGEHALTLTFSAGLTAFSGHEDSAALLRLADTGVYQAKKRGKNCIVVV